MSFQQYIITKEKKFLQVSASQMIMLKNHQMSAYSKIHKIRKYISN